MIVNSPSDSPRTRSSTAIMLWTPTSSMNDAPACDSFGRIAARSSWGKNSVPFVGVNVVWIVVLRGRSDSMVCVRA